RKSATWRGLSEAERAAPPLALIAAHPTVMKRPLIDAGGTLYLGWGPEVQAALLG
ncbi:MAG: arsenate reductase, partial [Roseovarius sp.]|nr:arsenate reductase [Roseovarius sp.]